jgi:hypothetical protein
VAVAAAAAAAAVDEEVAGTDTVVGRRMSPLSTEPMTAIHASMSALVGAARKKFRFTVLTQKRWLQTPLA